MKKAVTLAEILITLGIIGVVASLTIPTLLDQSSKSTQPSVSVNTTEMICTCRPKGEDNE